MASWGLSAPYIGLFVRQLGASDGFLILEDALEDVRAELGPAVF